MDVLSVPNGFNPCCFVRFSEFAIVLVIFKAFSTRTERLSVDRPIGCQNLFRIFVPQFVFVLGYIDCSKRRASPEDRDMCIGKFAKGNKINLILRNVAQKLNYKEDYQLEDLYSKSAWYFDEKYKQDNSSYEWFKKAVHDSSVLDECPLDNHTREALITEIQRRLAPNPVKIRSGQLLFVCQKRILI